MKKKKNVTAVSFDDLKQIVLNDAKKEDGVLTQDQIDNYLSTYDLNDDLAEELLEFIGNNDIVISDDGLDD
ncbi:MAG TPA: RNA polymerase sigma factor RpoD, partial [Thomasclavelia ramosa]|nr:RNA polymerase sigma factor RpoD [Thomasclavelia ramosa]